MITFLLFGRFQIRMPSGKMETITDTMSARILALLAYHGRFCSRQEIIKGCWGMHKLEGREKLEDEAYQRQISNLRAIFTRTLDVNWEDYLIVQPNGLQLRAETYTTDLIRLNDLLAIGLDVQRQAAERLSHLRETYSLRRGYLLDGMHCDWVVAYDGGARELLEARWDDVKRTVTVLDGLERNIVGRGSSSAICYHGIEEWLPVLRNMINSATEEIILYGINFHILVPMVRTTLLDRLRAGVNVKILMLDTNGTWLHEMSISTGNDELTLQAEGMAALSGLRGIYEKWRAEQAGMGGDVLAAGDFQVRTFDTMIHGRIYAIDPARTGGKLLLCPYMFGVSPSQLPCYLLTHDTHSSFAAYASELRRLWNSPLNQDFEKA